MDREQYIDTHTEGEGVGDENLHHNHLAKMLKPPQPRSFERKIHREIVKGRLYTLMKADGDGHPGWRGIRGSK